MINSKDQGREDSLYGYFTRRKFPQKEMAELLPLFSEIKLEQEEMLCHQGIRVNRVFFIEKGQTVLYTLGEKGDLLIKDFPGTGEFLLPQLKPDQSSSYYCQCLQASRFLWADYREILEKLSRCPTMNELFHSAQQEILEKTHQELETFRSMRGGERYLWFKEKFKDRLNAIPLYMAASYIGVTPTQLSRIRAENS